MGLEGQGRAEKSPVSIPVAVCAASSARFLTRT